MSKIKDTIFKGPKFDDSEPKPPGGPIGGMFALDPGSDESKVAGEKQQARKRKSTGRASTILSKKDYDLG